MRTAFIHRGADLIYGDSMDISEEAFSWETMAEADAFYVAMYPAAHAAADDLPEGCADYAGELLRVQGVTARGVFAGQ